jgi:oxalate decarboxylase/phosphoglucose isomerase-like protein (cupin superfamily)|tara:strand:- start:100 stop:435 length:336 start_codon:yes stop_codon:yes gene_type:complete
MIIPLDEFSKKGKLVKKDERYEVYDIEMEHLVASLTILFPGKTTTGHIHNNVEEVYYFSNGSGSILLNNKKLKVNREDIILIPKKTFHRVYNSGIEDLIFISIFEKYEGRK